jgi:tetratricopeptide (TPR) repeat protein
MRRKILALLAFIALTVPGKGAQTVAQGDSTKYLLLNYALQIEITDAVDHMYNFNFHKAEVEFNWLKYNYPEHPLPYFLYGISTWWQMMPNLNKVGDLGEEFLAHMDTAVVKSERLLDQDEDNIEALFFLAGSYGFIGRYHSEQKNWGRAANAGRLALKYLKRIEGNEGFSPEILFGDALFNYYSIWIRENYPMLRPILLFFPKGDKELGIKQMEEVAANAFYTRVEAIYFLMRIKAFEQKDTSEGLRLGKYIFSQYPNNPYFHRFYARMLYNSGNRLEAEKVSKEILHRLDSGMLGYEETSGRYASFFLGHINKGRGNWEEAEKYYLQSLRYAEGAEAEDTGYTLYAKLHLAKYYVDQGRYSEAEPLIDEIRDDTKRRSDTNKKARELDKEIRRNRKR